MVSLNARLEESESERRTTTAVKEALENVRLTSVGSSFPDVSHAVI